MLPPLEVGTGHLPPGRYSASLSDISVRFVSHPDFARSSTRRLVWEGFLDYLDAWDLAESKVGARVVLAWWIGGSFTSGEQDPDDLDLTPVLDDRVLMALDGKPGARPLKRLFGDRGALYRRFRVDPFPLRWSGLPSTLFPESLGPGEQMMLARRGGLDEWWTRLRPPGAKMGPQPPTRFAERGYLEVVR